jgi:imidazolonepropionase-like amidohydrolase
MATKFVMFWWGLVLSSGAIAATPPHPANNFAIQNVRVFDGTTTLTRQKVVVRDGRIVAVGPGAKIPAGTTVVDGSGKTLLPGLIDSHVHVFPGAQADALRFGVTTELDMFSAAADFPRWREQRESFRRVNEADTWSAGIGVTVPGGHPNKWVPENMPRLSPGTNAETFVSARIADGSDYIKLIIEDNAALDPEHRLNTLVPDEVCAVIAAARARGKLSIAHTTTQVNAMTAIDCGVNGLAHTFVDVPAGDELISRAKQESVFFISTVTLLDTGPRSAIAGPLSSGQKRSLNMTNPLVHTGDFGNALESLRRLHAAGVPILAGTDSPAPGTAHGVSIHQEIANLVMAGFTPEEALAAATSLPAELIGLRDRGRITPGSRADLVLVAGDPTANIRGTLRIEAIWKNGFPVSRETVQD